MQNHHMYTIIYSHVSSVMGDGDECMLSETNNHNTIYDVR